MLTDESNIGANSYYRLKDEEPAEPIKTTNHMSKETDIEEAAEKYIKDYVRKDMFGNYNDAEFEFYMRQPGIEADYCHRVDLMKEGYKYHQCQQSESIPAPEFVKDLIQVQQELIADMPTGEIKAWDCITVVSDHSKKLCDLIEKYQSQSIPAPVDKLQKAILKCAERIENYNKIKVIADYPQCFYNIGDIVICQDKEDLDFFLKWPHLFKKLESQSIPDKFEKFANQAEIDNAKFHSALSKVDVDSEHNKNTELEDKLQKAIDWCDEKIKQYKSVVEGFELEYQVIREIYEEMKQYLESIK